MKKILFFVFITALFVGCTEPTLENSIENPEQFTTVEHLKLPKDTIVVVNKDNYLYEFDEQGETIIHQYQLTNNHSIVQVAGNFWIVMLIAIALGFLLGVAILSN